MQFTLNSSLYSTVYIVHCKVYCTTLSNVFYRVRDCNYPSVGSQKILCIPYILYNTMVHGSLHPVQHWYTLYAAFTLVHGILLYHGQGYNNIVHCPKTSSAFKFYSNSRKSAVLLLPLLSRISSSSCGNTTMWYITFRSLNNR